MPQLLRLLLKKRQGACCCWVLGPDGARVTPQGAYVHVTEVVKCQSRVFQRQLGFEVLLEVHRSHRLLECLSGGRGAEQAAARTMQRFRGLPVPLLRE